MRRAVLGLATLAVACGGRGPVSVSTPTAPSMPCVFVPPPSEPPRTENVEAHGRIDLGVEPEQHPGLCGQFGLAAGEAPSIEHPAGTVFVAMTTAPEGSEPGLLAEIDLATQGRLRDVALPRETFPCDFSLARARRGFHLSSWGPGGRADYLRFDEALRLRTFVTAGYVERTGMSGFAADREGVTLVFDGMRAGAQPPENVGGMNVVAYDDDGALTGHHFYPYGPDGHAVGGLQGAVARVAGRTFLLVREGESTLSLAALGPSLEIEREVRLPLHTFGASLRLVGDRLDIDSYDDEQHPSVSLGLELIDTAPRAPNHWFHGRRNCQPPVRAGRTEAAMCFCQDRPCIEWVVRAAP